MKYIKTYETYNKWLSLVNQKSIIDAEIKKMRENYFEKAQRAASEVCDYYINLEKKSLSEFNPFRFSINGIKYEYTYIRYSDEKYKTVISVKLKSQNIYDFITFFKDQIFFKVIENILDKDTIIASIEGNKLGLM